MPLLNYPCDIILLIVDELGPKELSALMKTSRHLATLLTKRLHTFAIQDHDGMPALHWAADRGHEPLVRTLLEKGFDVTKKHRTYLGVGTAPIHLAAHNGKFEVVKALLGAGDSVNTINDLGQTPLFFAAKTGQETVARFLIENGAIDNKSDDGPLALVQAVCHNHKSLVRLLVEKGVNVNLQGLRGASVLHLAILNRLDSMVELLLDSGADMDARYYSDYTPLHCAIEHEQGAILKMLLDRGANQNAQSSEGDTPLHRAAVWGWVLGTRLLLEKADITVRNHRNLTAIQLAKWLGKMDIFFLILAKARKDNILEKVWNITKLFHFAAAQGWDELVKYLLIKGIDINLRSEGMFTLKDKGLTALMIAAEQNRESTVRLLIEYGADTSLLDTMGTTALGLAAQHSNESIVRILLEKVDIDKDILKNLILHKAAVNGHTEVIKSVMDRYPQIDVDHRDKSGQTMLQKRSAVIQSKPRWWFSGDSVFDLLLKKGADINALDNQGETLLHKAARAGTEYSWFLLGHGADHTIKSHNGDIALSFAEIC